MRMLKRPSVLASVLLITLTMLTSCAGSTVSDSACLIFGPIHGDRVNDTLETMRQIDGHNAVGVAVCEW